MQSWISIYLADVTILGRHRHRDVFTDNINANEPYIEVFDYGIDLSERARINISFAMMIFMRCVLIAGTFNSVSYTHLTLPTIYSV